MGDAQVNAQMSGSVHGNISMWTSKTCEDELRIPTNDMKQRG